MAPKHKRRRERKRLYKNIVGKHKQINYLTSVKLTRDAQKKQRLRKLFHGHTFQCGKIARARWRLDREQKQQHTDTWMRMHYNIVQEPVRKCHISVSEPGGNEALSARCEENIFFKLYVKITEKNMIFPIFQMAHL